MDKLRQAAEMVLEALEWYVDEDDVVESMAGNEPWVEGKRKAEKSIQALRQALNVDAVNISEERVHKTEKSIHEPVGYVTNSGTAAYLHRGVYLEDDTPLYTAPPKKEWVGLTDEEIYAPWPLATRIEFARWVEAKLKEKNA